MDIMLSQGDIALTPAGGRRYISGADEALQRFMLVASTEKGSFRYRREFGVDFSDLSINDPLLKEKLEIRFQVAAAGILDTRVRVSAVDPENMTASVTIIACGQERTTEVDLNGKL